MIFNANRKGWISKEALEACLETITTLNKTASEVLQGFTVHAATDVTGFGIAGHSLEMAEGSDTTLRIETEAVPIMAEALESYKRGMTTGVNAVNRELVQEKMRFERELPTWHEEIFVDPQTSGGILAAVSPEEADGGIRGAARGRSGQGGASRDGRSLRGAESPGLRVTAEPLVGQAAPAASVVGQAAPADSSREDEAPARRRRSQRAPSGRRGRHSLPYSDLQPVRDSRPCDC